MTLGTNPTSTCSLDVDYQRFGFIPFMDLRDYLAGLLGCKVDFNTRNALHPELRDRIKPWAIKVFGDTIGRSDPA
jgi:predicted nucleotidyltransferase